MSADSNSLHIFEVLATQHEPMLMSYLVSLVGDYALAEDVAQQALVIAYRKIKTLKDPSAFPSWLRGIARLEGLAALRRRGREIPIAPETIEEMDEAYRRIEEEHPAETWRNDFIWSRNASRSCPTRSKPSADCTTSKIIKRGRSRRAWR